MSILPIKYTNHEKSNASNIFRDYREEKIVDKSHSYPLTNKTVLNSDGHIKIKKSNSVRLNLVTENGPANKAKVGRSQKSSLNHNRIEILSRTNTMTISSQKNDVQRSLENSRKQSVSRISGFDRTTIFTIVELSALVVGEEVLVKNKTVQYKSE